MGVRYPALRPGTKLDNRVGPRITAAADGLQDDGRVGVGTVNPVPADKGHRTAADRRAARRRHHHGRGTIGQRARSAPAIRRDPPTDDFWPRYTHCVRSTVRSSMPRSTSAQTTSWPRRRERDGCSAGRWSSDCDEGITSPTAMLRCQSAKGPTRIPQHDLGDRMERHHHE